MNLSEMLFRILTAFVTSGVVGLERQIHGRPAGLRTHILVGTGACIAVLAGILAAENLPDLAIDTGRIAAGIITGVGFLGAGTIVHYREGVGGLTTAACIWFVAMTGILAGFGFILLAMVSSALAITVLILLDNLEDRLPKASYWRLTIKFGRGDTTDAVETCRKMLRENRINVKSSCVSLSDHQTVYAYVLRTRKKGSFDELLHRIRSLENVQGLKWTHRNEEL